LPVVTQAATLDELTANIQEAIALHLEGEDLHELGLAENPTILAEFGSCDFSQRGNRIKLRDDIRATPTLAIVYHQES
jgi:hypothetical protein